MNSFVADPSLEWPNTGGGLPSWVQLQLVSSGFSREFFAEHASLVPALDSQVHSTAEPGPGPRGWRNPWRTMSHFIIKNIVCCDKQGGSQKRMPALYELIGRLGVVVHQTKLLPL
jgi:hypothetical protein